MEVSSVLQGLCKLVFVCVCVCVCVCVWGGGGEGVKKEETLKGREHSAFFSFLPRTGVVKEEEGWGISSRLELGLGA